MRTIGLLAYPKEESLQERERILERIRELADSEEEERRCAELLDAARSGLERGLSSEVERNVKDVLQGLVRQLDEAAGAIEARIRD